MAKIYIILQYSFLVNDLQELLIHVHPITAWMGVYVKKKTEVLHVYARLVFQEYIVKLVSTLVHLYVYLLIYIIWNIWLYDNCIHYHAEFKAYVALKYVYMEATVMLKMDVLNAFVLMVTLETDVKQVDYTHMLMIHYDIVILFTI